MGRQSLPDSVQARLRQTNDSLVRAGLAEAGARLEYRWVLRTDSAAAQQHPSLFDPFMRRWLILNDTLALDLSQADSVEVASGSGAQSVMLRLGLASADRLLSNTAAHVGSQLAVVLNGHLLVAPVIRTPFAGQIPVIPDVDSTVARELAERLRDALPRSGRH